MKYALTKPTLENNSFFLLIYNNYNPILLKIISLIFWPRNKTSDNFCVPKSNSWSTGVTVSSLFGNDPMKQKEANEAERAGIQ